MGILKRKSEPLVLMHVFNFCVPDVDELRCVVPSKEYRFQHIAGGKSVTANVLNNYKKSSKKDPVKAHLRRRYSFLWQNKIRLLLITGDEAAIEQLVPACNSSSGLKATAPC